MILLRKDGDQGLDAALWERLKATLKPGTSVPTMGADWDALNVWVLRRVSQCPAGVEPYRWIEMGISPKAAPG